MRILRSFWIDSESLKGFEGVGVEVKIFFLASWFSTSFFALGSDFSRSQNGAGMTDSAVCPSLIRHQGMQTRPVFGCSLNERGMRSVLWYSGAQLLERMESRVAFDICDHDEIHVDVRSCRRLCLKYAWVKEKVDLDLKDCSSLRKWQSSRGLEISYSGTTWPNATLEP